MSAELTRRIDNLIRFGIIAEVDHATARARVKSGQILTDFCRSSHSVPAQQQRGRHRLKANNAWFYPQAVNSLRLAYWSGFTPNSPSHSPDVHVIKFADGASIEYNQTSGRLNVVGIKSAFINASQQIEIFCPTVKIKGDVKIEGSVTSTGDMTAGGISQINHKHGGVQGGQSKTGKPE